MFTTQKPDHCPRCMSKKVHLGNEIFKKDEDGEDTDIAILGTWFCNECGEVIGRKISQYENDLSPDSI